jgi:uncharacterized phage protein (TIGR01671 family)
MNRELKFRVWNTLTKKTYYTGFAVQANGHIMLDGSLIRDDNLAAGWKIYENEGELIPQQFTGLKDKNGKEIYEGDILDVAEDEGEHQYVFVEWDAEASGWGTSDGLLFDGMTIEFCEIVGNVFENPELIK